MNLRVSLAAGSLPQACGALQRMSMLVCLALLLAMAFSRATVQAQTLAYVSEQSGAVSVVDVANDSVLQSIPVGSAPFGIATTPDGAAAYVVNFNDGTVSVIATASNTVVATIPVGVGPSQVAITPDGRFAYVPNNNSSNVSVIATATNTVAATIEIGTPVFDVAFTPNGAFAYVTNPGASATKVIDTGSDTVVASIPSGFARQIDITPDGAFAYVSDFIAGSVSVVATATATVVASVPVGLFPEGVAVTPDGALAYVANNNDNTVSVIATGTNTVVATVPVGGNPVGVAVTPDGAFAYVANNSSSNVSVISTASNTVAATIPVGPGPTDIAFITSSGAILPPPPPPHPIIGSFEMISNGNGPIPNVAGFDNTTAPTGHGAYSADWYRDVLSGGSILSLPNGMQANAGWYFVVAGLGAVVDFTTAADRWLRSGNNDSLVAGNCYEIRFTAAGGQAFMTFSSQTLVDVPFELWYLAHTPSDPSDDVRMVPWLNDTDGDGEFSFKLDHEASFANNDPFSDWIYFIMPVDDSPAQAGYDQFVLDATNGTYALDGQEHLARLVLMNYDQHQNESGPGAGDGPVNAFPETGTTFRLSFKGTQPQVAVPTVTAANDADIIATPPGSFQATSGELFFRMAGANTYQNIGMIQSGNDFQASVPSASVTFRGIEYYVSLNDGQNVVTFPGIDPVNNPAVLAVNIPTMTYQSELQPQTYKMFSIPLNLQNTTIDSLLFDDYGAYDIQPQQWRAFRFENGDYVEHPNIAAQVTPGSGLWLITRNGVAFDIENSQSVDTSNPIDLVLQPGWNQIGTPFAFAVDWSDVTASGNVQQPVAYDGSQYQFNMTTLDPWEAYFIFNLDSTPVTLTIPPTESQNTIPTAVNYGTSTGDFILKLSAIAPAAGLIDTENYIGFRSGSKQGLDNLDFLEPPPLGHFVRLFIVEDGRDYAGNFKPLDQVGKMWDVEVTSSRKGEQVEISLETNGDMPDGFAQFILDLDENRVIPQSATFSLKTSDEFPVRHLRVILGTDAFAGEHAEDIALIPFEFGLEQNYPNPFNGETTIRYQLNEPGDVRLEIFNLLGQHVRTLLDAPMETGAYSIRWHGRDDAGTPVASGIYIYRLRSGTNATATRKLAFLK